MPHRLDISLYFCVLLLCLTLALTLAAPDAHAGSYSLTYTGGQTKAVGVGTTPPGTTLTTPYSFNFDGSNSYGGSNTVSWANRTASVTCSLGITATATWQSSGSGDTAPACVIVEQIGTASWNGQGSGSAGPTGKCDDGLKDPEMDTATNPPPSGPPPSYSGVSTGTHWSVLSSPGSSFPLSLTPSASVFGTGTSGPPSVSGSGNASVRYTAAVFPITISLGGTYNPNVSDNRVLTGQQITATLQGIPGGFTVTHYTWSVGGSAFKTYDPTLASNQLVPLASADLVGPAAGGTTVSPLKFYDRAAENLTVTCAVTLTAPDGTSLSLTATSPTINVLKPTAKWSVETGNVYYNHVTNAYGLYPAFNTGYTDGVYWHDAVVTILPPFSGGTCCFTQLAQPNHQYNGKGVGQYNNLNSLDNSFEYYNYSWPAGSAGTNNDSPAIQAGSGITIGDTLTANDTLQAWLMYQPAGGVWVPIQMYTYTWAVTLTWADPGVTWTVSGASPPPPNPGPAHTPAATNIPPQWATTLTNRE